MNIALFDFDGTVTTRETFPDFIRQAVPPKRLALGKLLLAPLVLGYRAGVVSGTTVRASIVKFGFTGLPASDVECAGAAFAQDVLPTLLRADVMDRIAWHKAQGATVAVVSGGFDVYLAPWCDTHGLALLCSRLEHVDGILTGRYLGPQCVGEEKAARIRAAYDLWRYAQIHAYGDTPEDRAMLALATHKTYRGQRVA